MCNSDTILDSGATQSIFPLNYRHLTEFKRDSSYAVMADQTSKLTLYGSAKYGCFDVLVADINRPLLSEGAITGPPYNLTVLKSRINAWILDPSKTSNGYFVTVRRSSIIYITFIIQHDYYLLNLLFPLVLV